VRIHAIAPALGVRAVLEVDADGSLMAIEIEGDGDGIE